MWLERTESLLGADALAVLKNARVAVLGLGGVGGSAAEALLRSGVGHLLLVDSDTVSNSNRNRQLLATAETVGMDKVEAAYRRFSAAVPEAELTLKKEFYLPENRDFLFDWKPDCVIDAIDTVTAKLDLSVECEKRQIPLLMCLGTGNRLRPEALRLGDISETAGCGCGLARVMRHELKKRGILRQTVLYSTEEPRPIVAEESFGRHAPGSTAFVPPVAGYLLASEAVRRILERE